MHPYEQIARVSEGAVSNKVVSLGAFAGKKLLLRFSLTYLGGSVFTCCDPIGWCFDDVAFIKMQGVGTPVLSAVSASTSFLFNPPEHATSYDLEVRPQSFGSGFGHWGPATLVSSPK